jgi:hypothetical protein
MVREPSPSPQSKDRIERRRGPRPLRREDELARLITTTPAVYPWMILKKLEVLECYLGGFEGSTNFVDNREVVMLAGIKADLLRFVPHDPTRNRKIRPLTR